MPMYLDALPPETLRQVFEFLPPDGLLNLRGMPEMQEHVDAFLQDAAGSNRFQDSMGRAMSEAGNVDGQFDPDRLLQDWIAGDIGTSAFPPSTIPADANLAHERFDGAFSLMPINEVYHRGLAEGYAELAEGNTIHALELRQDFHTYVRHLLNEGRFNDGDGNRLDPMPAPDAIDLWIAGDIHWRQFPVPD